MTLRISTRVLAGHRIEVTAPELAEGEQVDVLLVSRQELPQRISMLDLIKLLPAGPRSAPTWERLEHGLQTERDAWER